jgi:hypothetical protein
VNGKDAPVLRTSPAAKNAPSQTLIPGTAAKGRNKRIYPYLCLLDFKVQNDE